MTRSGLLAMVAVCVLGGSTAQGQEPASAAPRTLTPPQTLTTTTSLVVVPALVRNKAGQVVYSLKAQDFTLTDDGAPQALHLEEDTGGEPLALVVVIEADAATRAAGWHPYRHAGAPDRFHGVPAMIQAMTAGVRHRIAVVGFDSRPELELPFTANADEVADTIAQLDHGNAGDHGAGILDSLVFAVDLLRSAPTGYRRVILLLSETNDRGSRVSLDDAVRAITETNTAIYSVAFSTPFHQASEYGNKQLPTKAMSFDSVSERDTARAAAGAPPMTPEERVFARILQGAIFGISLENPYPNPPGGCMGADPDTTTPVLFHDRLNKAFDCLAQLAPPLGVAKLALIAATGEMRNNIPRSVTRLTGGEYFEFNNAKTLEAELATLSNHIPNRYILTFQPQSPHAGLHVLTLTLNRNPQLHVTARSTYWAESTAPAK